MAGRPVAPRRTEALESADGVRVMIYFIQSSHMGPMKIGYSKSRAGVWRRLKYEQTGNPDMLYLRGIFPGKQSQEGCLHDALDLIRVRPASEWFRTDVPVLGKLSLVAQIMIRMDRGTAWHTIKKYIRHQIRDPEVRQLCFRDVVYLADEAERRNAIARDLCGMTDPRAVRRELRREIRRSKLLSQLRVSSQLVASPHVAPAAGALLNAAQVGELLGLNASAVVRDRDALCGVIPAPIRAGRSFYYWRRAEIGDWLAAGCPSMPEWTWPATTQSSNVAPDS